ncbi:MAG: hypothetical protein R3D33_12195 [Hyphomicrobiaceae bacterium]
MELQGEALDEIAQLLARRSRQARQPPEQGLGGLDRRSQTVHELQARQRLEAVGPAPEFRPAHLLAEAVLQLRPARRLDAPAAFRNDARQRRDLGRRSLRLEDHLRQRGRRPVECERLPAEIGQATVGIGVGIDELGDQPVAVVG